MTITEKLSRLKGINIETLFDEVLKENEETILDMNRSQMYDEGIMNIKNPSSQEHYSPATIKAKRKAPFSKTEFITLKWKGKFHSDLKLLIHKDDFVIVGDNLIWKMYLVDQDRFGGAVGLTAKSKSELREIARDELIKKIRNVA